MDGFHDFRYFDAIDYTVFAVLLSSSALIGVYFAFWAKRKQNTTAEYLLGSKEMGIFPISMSLIASYISGIAILGIPSEMYVYGTQFWMLIFAELTTEAFMAFAIIPVFYEQQITSSYEYLNRRFSPAVRTLGSILFICKMMLYIPIVIYVPALAFAQVSGFSLQVVIPIICCVCIFYTTLGGMKAVVWTDTLQTILMVAGVIVVVIMGTYDVGGFQEVIKRNQKGERLDFFNTSWDPTIRHTLWNILIGKFFSHMAGCTINQAMVQRCLAMPNIRRAQLTILIFSIGIAFFVNLSCYTGLVIYAAFNECDPVSAGTISKADQLLPYFVMKITSHVPALPGIFVSGVFSASLSTMSTGLNSMCGVILQDFIRPLHKAPLSENRASVYMKIITVLLGIICTIFAFIVEQLSGIIQASGSLGGITAGTLLGMFMLGMFIPWANAYGALIGGISAAVLVSFMSIGSQLAIHDKRLVFPVKPVTLEGCDNLTMSHYFNITSQLTQVTADVPLEPPFIMFAISYVYYTVIGLVTVLVVGMLVSWFTGLSDPADMDPLLFSPFIRPFLPKGVYKAKILKEKDPGYIATVLHPGQMKPLLNQNESK